MNFDQLAKAPFNLDAEAIAWVKSTLAGLTPDDKLRQLFNLRIAGNNPADLDAVRAFRPGGITRHSGADMAAERALIASLNAAAPVPLLVSADLEGSRMSLAGGAEMPNPLALAAIDDVEVTAEVSRIMAEEARAVGINWSFTPVLDINAAFRSAIVATRGFGSDVATIEKHALTQMRVFQEHGVASAVKHWPGEGYDDRDQHLVTTINPLSMDEWEATFGRLYRGAVEAGALSVMSGHIALPAFVRSIDPAAGIEAFRPASLSRLLNEELLRKRLGFNGLIVSDATAMAGMGSWAKRSETLPELVTAGCDVILFANNPEQDLGYVRKAVEDGRLTMERVDEAIARQLGLKAALGLHRPAAEIGAIATAQNQAYAEGVAQRAPTQVKDTQDLLPLDPRKHRRVLVVSGGIVFPFLPHPLPFALPEMLRQQGFEVTEYTPDMEVSPERFDLMLYLFGDETLLTRGRIFLDWLALTGHFGKAMQRYWHEIPTAMISFGYPYMLYDAPRVPTYINAYSTTETMQRAVVNLLLGKGQWNRNSPVDPFCGLEDARY
ncbi:glycoside hydrolase family 3 N-terminal domain-containing protein [Devosia sp. ZB163]|uniref:glycoside hydrolase family 3 protein n=1 Tax=Devosia sp. ZB163 TaxID=3025938 RepID=UPI00236196B8|nr:glycoside hydrolase family 3 N-terminal domain-containing protein [Devosia sp. ZB163]MDC9822913.1 glycoside hydrolase family 3 N-terminal domain-containing protein [Devosia sp. ZB163]